MMKHLKIKKIRHEELNLSEHALMLLDFQHSMAEAVGSVAIPSLKDRLALISQSAAVFAAPTILGLFSGKHYQGELFTEVKRPFPKLPPIVHTTINAMDSWRISEAITKTYCKQLVIAGLWTSIGIADAAISAVKKGLRVYLIHDACADISTETHERAIHRMAHHGVLVIDSMDYLLALRHVLPHSKRTAKTKQSSSDTPNRSGLSSDI